MKLVITGRPRPKARPRVTNRGTYSPTADIEQAIRWAAYQAQPEMSAEPQKLTVRFYPDRTEIELEPTETGRGRHHRPDLPNLVAMVADALQTKKDKKGLIWPGAIVDDCQITEIHAYKLNDETSRLAALDRAKAVKERIRARTGRTFDTVQLVDESRAQK